MLTREWKKVVGELSSTPKQIPKVLQKSRAPRNVPTPPSTREPSPPEDSETDDFESEGAVEEELLADSDEQISLLKMCWEGGTEAINFLLAKAVSPTATAPTEKSPKEWSYHDLACLNPQELELWRTACTEELNALKKRDTFELVDRPTNRKTIKNCWVFNVKSDRRRKACLVAKGFSQVEGLDFDQIFSPVVCFETVRLILALAALEGWTVSGLDVKSAYLYGTLDEEIYMEQPEGFIDANHPKKVLKLQKALYGLKQAGLAWWRAMKQSMEDLGFECLNSDAGVFLYRKKGNSCIAVVYVDDSFFTGPNKALNQQLKEAFMKRWECRDLGEITEFLGMKISRSGSKIQLDQCTYLRTVLERCGMHNSKKAATPLPAGYVPIRSEVVASPELQSKYQMVIGSLLYLMLGTRPDITFAVTKMAQFAANPSKDHLNRVLYICRYLVGTQSYRLMYDGGAGQGLSATTDSDWAANTNDCRSQTGFFLRLAGVPISWTSHAQKTIAFSSTEAKYMALSNCSQQVVWVHTLLGELGYTLKPILIRLRTTSYVIIVPF